MRPPSPNDLHPSRIGGWTGLLRHQLTRIYFPDEPNETDPVFAPLSDEERETLLAVAEDGALRFDIRMQGDRATVFFDH